MLTDYIFISVIIGASFISIIKADGTDSKLSPKSVNDKVLELRNIFGNKKSSISLGVIYPPQYKIHQRFIEVLPKLEVKWNNSDSEYLRSLSFENVLRSIPDKVDSCNDIIEFRAILKSAGDDQKSLGAELLTESHDILEEAKAICRPNQDFDLEDTTACDSDPYPLIIKRFSQYDNKLMDFLKRYQPSLRKKAEMAISNCFTISYLLSQPESIW